MKIYFVTGAGISQESGVPTFRERSGIWEKYNPEKVATLKGWEIDPQFALDFYNHMQGFLNSYEPNSAHIDIAKLAEKHEVKIFTQNVDLLHEKAGSKNIIHLHGQINQCRSSVNHLDVYPYPEELKIGDLCKQGSQLRPDVVFFDEHVYKLQESFNSIQDADIVVFIGTSFVVSTPGYLFDAVYGTKQIYIIDPNIEENTDLDNVYFIKEKATTGILTLIKLLDL